MECNFHLLIYGALLQLQEGLCLYVHLYMDILLNNDPSLHSRSSPSRPFFRYAQDHSDYDWALANYTHSWSDYIRDEVEDL